MKTLLIFFACYLAVALLLNSLAIGYRKELVEKVRQAKMVEGLTDRQVAVLDSYVLSMRSLRTSVILFLIFGVILLMPKEQLLRSPNSDFENAGLWDDGLMPRILDLHLASAACANPIFGALAYGMKWVVNLRYKHLFGADGEKHEARSVSARYASC